MIEVVMVCALARMAAKKIKKRGFSCFNLRDKCFGKIESENLRDLSQLQHTSCATSRHVASSNNSIKFIDDAVLLENENLQCRRASKQ